MTIPVRPYPVRGTIPCPMVPGHTRSAAHTSHMESVDPKSMEARELGCSGMHACYERVRGHGRRSATVKAVSIPSEPRRSVGPAQRFRHNEERRPDANSDEPATVVSRAALRLKATEVYAGTLKTDRALSDRINIADGSKRPASSGTS